MLAPAKERPRDAGEGVYMTVAEAIKARVAE